jgi:hypothetical protein
MEHKYALFKREMFSFISSDILSEIACIWKLCFEDDGRMKFTFDRIISIDTYLYSYMKVCVFLLFTKPK